MGIRTELTLRLPNSPGALAAVCRTLADERVNIAAVSLDASGQLHLIVDNPGRAARRAARRGIMQVDRARRSLVVSPSHSPGGLAPLLALLARRGRQRRLRYTAAAWTEAPSAVVVLGVDDPMRAAAATGFDDGRRVVSRKSLSSESESRSP